MTEFLLFSKGFPLVLHFDGLIAPLFSNDLGDFRIGNAGVLSYHFGLMMLAVQDESYMMSARSYQVGVTDKQRTVTRPRYLGVRLADADVGS